MNLHTTENPRVGGSILFCFHILGFIRDTACFTILLGVENFTEVMAHLIIEQRSKVLPVPS